MQPVRGALPRVVVPIALTWLLALARLAGELADGPAWLFSTASGGGTALVGVLWLVPVFGVWFAASLVRAGSGPKDRLRAICLHLLAAAIYVGGFQLAGRVDGSTHAGIATQILCMGGVAVVAGAVAYAAWPGLAAVNLLYGLGVRAATAAITVVAVLAAWGTHFEKLGPRDYAAMPRGEVAAWLAFTQIAFWVPFTVVGGGLFGSLSSLAMRKHRSG